MKIEVIKSYCIKTNDCKECRFFHVFGACPFIHRPYEWTSEEMKELQSALVDLALGRLDTKDTKEADVDKDESDKVENDNVNHPSHYCQDGSMECIDEMVEVFGVRAVMSFCLCNVWKYRKRAMFKNGKEDLEKSDWYMKKYTELKKEAFENEYY